MKTFEEFIKTKEPIPFKVLSWQPKKHFKYWFYTFLLYIPIKKFRSYIFTKRCNFVNKPLFDVLNNKTK